MIEHTAWLLYCQGLSIDKCVDGSISDHDKLKESVLFQSYLAMILLDSCRADNDIGLWIACLATDQDLAFGQRVVLDAGHLRVFVQVDDVRD